LLHVGVGRRNAQNVGSGSGASLIKALNPALWFRYGIGLTNAAGLCPAWADQSGNGRNFTAAGAARPTIQSDNALLFDGSANVLQTAGFTLDQPLTCYLLVQQVTWAGSARLTSGISATVTINEVTSSPIIAINAGSSACSNGGLALGVYGVVSAVINGAASSLQINNGSPVSGNPGTNNPGGYAIGASAGGANASNILVKETVVFPAAHDAATRRNVINYLGQVGNISV
jgi:hypothetical protein